MFNRQWNPPNRHDGLSIEWDEPPPPARLQISVDHTREILVRNRSPDVGFEWGVNPYRGCSHACAYCYARAFHEHLGLGAGSDFERRIAVKPEAPALLARAFERRSWRGEVVAFSGATDCYQPLERRFELTRGCLQVCARYRNPVSLITRSPLVVRDLDLLAELAAHRAVRVTFSIPILDPHLCRALEPGAPPPEARLRAMAALHEAGVPVGVGLAPLIPGVNDRLVPETLQRAREAGAAWAFTQLVRLSPSVATVFEARLREALPTRADTILARLRRARGGSLDDPRFHLRKQGEDEAWRATRRLFDLWVERLGFGEAPPWPDPSPFQRPGAQLGLW